MIRRRTHFMKCDNHKVVAHCYVRKLYHAMSKQDWFSAKTIFKHHRVEDGKTKTVFEERVVLLRATGFDDAIAKAEAEAAVYCGTGGDKVYLGFVDVFHLFDEKVG